MNCLVCKTAPCDPAHVKTRGSHGGDTEDNVISLCRKHHTEQGQIGWVKFCYKYSAVERELNKKGWEIKEEFGFKKLRKF